MKRTAFSIIDNPIAWTAKIEGLLVRGEKSGMTLSVDKYTAFLRPVMNGIM